jgi:hypothetical protein
VGAHEVGYGVAVRCGGDKAGGAKRQHNAKHETN